MRTEINIWMKGHAGYCFKNGDKLLSPACVRLKNIEFKCSEGNFKTTNGGKNSSLLNLSGQ